MGYTAAMTDEGVPGPKSVKDTVDEAFAPLEAERVALTAEAEAALRESAATRTSTDEAITAHLKQMADGLEGFATALGDVEEARNDGVLTLTEVVAPDDEDEDPTK